ncbi:hypothetical protein F9817_23020 [Vibrio sp. CAIM 722]|uniref:Uncharacterized protein n=1 Tax=Vibrio eleionomae TaxID=2653505 RepID=A0A7X4LQS3_9VIBR|nr:hypothetical protein [Vibrio eleionomae]MZI96061.1 hypothetical protein [Vibrio eleionomae]
MINTKFCDFIFISEKLKSYYPNSGFRLSPLVRKYLTNGDLLEDFCQKAKIKFEGLINNIEDSNSGLSSSLCSSFSKINTIYADIHDQSVKQSIANLTPNSKKLRDKHYDFDLSGNVISELIKVFEEKNELLWKRYFPKLSFEDTMSLRFLRKNLTEIDDLKNKIEKLEDLIAIQMDMILELEKKNR